MPYIPENHQKYDLLPLCRRNGGEVLAYCSESVEELKTYVPKDQSLIPYGYDSYEEYDAMIKQMAEQYADRPDIIEKFERFRREMKELNTKEVWSVLRYVGPDIGTFGLTSGKNYYWPCTEADPEYCGVIDDEEFTSYLYPTDDTLWEILEDPTGMAHRTLHCGEGF